MASAQSTTGSLLSCRSSVRLRVMLYSASRAGEPSTSARTPFSRATRVGSGGDFEKSGGRLGDAAAKVAEVHPGHRIFAGSSAVRGLSEHSSFGDTEESPSYSFGGAGAAVESAFRRIVASGENWIKRTRSLPRPPRRRPTWSISQESRCSEASCSDDRSSTTSGDLGPSGSRRPESVSTAGATPPSDIAASRLEDARLFSSTAAAVIAGHQQPLRKSQRRSSSFAYVDQENCKVAVLLGAAHRAGEVDSVASVREVKVDNATGYAYFVFDHVMSLLKRGSLKMGDLFGMRARRTWKAHIGIPAGCVADDDSMYFTFRKDEVTRSSEPAAVDSLVLSLTPKRMPFRVPWTLRPVAHFEELSLSPEKWTNLGCSWFLTFSRALDHLPILRIDPYTGMLSFDNPELHDLGHSLQGTQAKSGTPCAWFSPSQCRVHVSTDLRNAPPTYRIQLDLDPGSSTDQSSVHYLKCGSGEDEGDPQESLRRGLSPRRRRVTRSSVG